jgi:hypothetical protein
MYERYCERISVPSENSEELSAGLDVEPSWK